MYTTTYTSDGTSQSLRESHKRTCNFGKPDVKCGANIYLVNVMNITDDSFAVNMTKQEFLSTWSDKNVILPLYNIRDQY